MPGMLKDAGTLIVTVEAGRSGDINSLIPNLSKTQPITII
jgi:hypothetical protein